MSEEEFDQYEREAWEQWEEETLEQYEKEKFDQCEKWEKEEWEKRLMQKESREEAVHGANSQGADLGDERQGAGARMSERRKMNERN